MKAVRRAQASAPAPFARRRAPGALGAAGEVAAAAQLAVGRGAGRGLRAAAGVAGGEPLAAEPSPRSRLPLAALPIQPARATHLSVRSRYPNRLRAVFSPWGNVDDADCGQYLWNDRDVAQDYADELLLDPSDIWEVDISGIEVIPDPSITPDTPEYGGYWHPHAFYTAQTIEPERLKLVGHDRDQTEALRRQRAAGAAA